MIFSIRFKIQSHHTNMRHLLRFHASIFNWTWGNAKLRYSVVGESGLFLLGSPCPCICGLISTVCGMSSVHRQVSDCAKSCLLLKQHFLAITLRGVRWWFPEQWHGKTRPKHWNKAWTQAFKWMTQLSFRKQYNTYFRWHFLYLQQLHNTEKWKDKMKNSKITRTIFQILLNWFLSKFMIPSPSAYASEFPITSLPLFPWSKPPRSFRNSFRNLIRKKKHFELLMCYILFCALFFSPVLFLGLLLWQRSLFCVLLLEVLACISFAGAYELHF